MLPDLSRRLAHVLGRMPSTPSERGAVVDAAIKVDTWDQLPQSVRDLVEEIESRARVASRGPTVAAVSSANLEQAARILEQLRRRVKDLEVLEELDLILFDLRNRPDSATHLPGQHDQASHGRQRTGVLGNVLGRLEGLRGKLSDDDRAELDRAMDLLRGLESSDVDDDDLIDPEEEDQEEDETDLTMESATGDLTFIPYNDGDIDVDWEDGSIRFTATSAREVADAVEQFASLPEAPGFPDPGQPPEWVVDQPTYQQWYSQVYREWEQSPAGQANTGTVGEIVTSDGETKVARYGNGVTWIGDPEAVDFDDPDGVITLDNPQEAREFAEKMREALQRAHPTTAGYEPPIHRPSLITHLAGQHNQQDHAGDSVAVGEGFMRLSGGDYHRMFGDAFDEIDAPKAGVTVRVFGDGRAHMAADGPDGSRVVLTNSEVSGQEFEELSDDLSAVWDGDGGEILSAADLTFAREPGADVEVSRSSDGQVIMHLGRGESRQLARAFTEAARSLQALDVIDNEPDEADEDFIIAAVSTMPARLQAYWLTGEGAAKVRWCTPGSFRRAQRALRAEGVPAHMVDGAVANLYRKACGKSPGRHRSDTVIETAAAMPVEAADHRLLAPQPGEHWHSVVHREGVSTGKRTWLPGSVEWREPPFAAHQEVVSSAHGSSPVTVHIGNATRTIRDGNDLHVYGNIDLGSSQGAEWARRLVEGFGGWPSFGPGSEAFEYDVVHPLDAAIDEPEQVLFRRYRMGEVTFVSVPGQEGTFVEPTAELLALLGREPVTAAVGGRKYKRDRKGRFAETDSAGVILGLDKAKQALEDLRKSLNEDEQAELDEALGYIDTIREGRQAEIQAGGASTDAMEAANGEVTFERDGDAITFEWDGGNQSQTLTAAGARALAAAIDDLDTLPVIKMPRGLDFEERFEWNEANAEAMEAVSGERTSPDGDWKVVKFGGGEYEIGDPAGTPTPEGAKEVTNLVLGDEDEAEEFANILDALAETITTAAAAPAVQAPVGPSWFVEIPNLPPPDWFVEPDDYPYGYAVTMTDDGHIFGLLAPHNAAHRTYAQMGERRTLASLGKVDFSRWQKETVVAGGKRVLAGPLTMECMHAPTQGYGKLDRRNQHYQDTCSIFARVAVGNCRNGEGHWINGAAMPGVTSEQVLKFLASDVSGDWQPHPDKPGWVELIAVLAVPSGGWPKSKTGVPSAVTRIRETEHGAIMVASAVPTRFETSQQPIVVDDEVIYGLAASLGMNPAARIAAEATRIRSSLEV